MTDLEQIAKGLTRAARRSIVEMRPEWCCSFNVQGHRWLTSKGLVEHITGNCGKITPLGTALRNHLLQKEQGR